MKPLSLKFLSALTVMALLAWPDQTLAWGPSGHRIVAELAQRHLSEGAAQQVALLLGGDSLAEVANWPDEIRSDPSWNCARDFHFVNVAEGARYPEDGISKDGDAVAAVVYYSTLLADQAADLQTRAMALRFLVHFVGDLSQPLHIGYKCDTGGNSIHLSYFGEETNLHSVWDDKMVEARRLSFTEFADFLNEPGTSPAAEHLDPLNWVKDVQHLLPQIYRCHKSDRCPSFCGDRDAQTYVFGGCRKVEQCELMVGGQVTLSWAYVAAHKESLENQLLQGGLRLAGLLNALLGEGVVPEALQSLHEKLDQHRDWEAPFQSCRGGE